MRTLICCAVLPLVSFLSAAGFAGGKDNAFISEKEMKRGDELKAEQEANVISSLQSWWTFFYPVE